MQLSNRYTVNTILYANDQVLISKSEDKLQISAYHLMVKKYTLRMSTSEMKSVGMCRSDSRWK
jgi:hypothetical protein